MAFRHLSLISIELRGKLLSPSYETYYYARTKVVHIATRVKGPALYTGQKIKHRSQANSLGSAIPVYYAWYVLGEALLLTTFSFSSTLSKISQSHQLSFLPPSPFAEDKINRIGIQKSLSRVWVKTTINPLVLCQQSTQTPPSADPVSSRTRVPVQFLKIQEKVMSQFLYLDQICLELQQQQNAVLSPRGGEK